MKNVTERQVGAAIEALLELVRFLGRLVDIFSQLAGGCRGHLHGDSGLVAILIAGDRQRLEHDGYEVSSAFDLGKETDRGNWQFGAAGLGIDFSRNMQVPTLRIWHFETEHGPMLSAAGAGWGAA